MKAAERSVEIGTFEHEGRSFSAIGSVIDPEAGIITGYPVEAGAYWVGWLGDSNGQPGLPGDVFDPPYASWRPIGIGEAADGRWGSYVATRGPFATRADAKRARHDLPSQVVQPFNLHVHTLTNWAGHTIGSIQLLRKARRRMFGQVVEMYYWRMLLNGRRYSGRNSGLGMHLALRACKPRPAR